MIASVNLLKVSYMLPDLSSNFAKGNSRKILMSWVTLMSGNSCNLLSIIKLEKLL